MPCTKDCVAPSLGTRVAHCGSCHVTFSGITNFDAHRRNGKCEHPALWLMTEKNGVWGFHGTMPTQVLTGKKNSGRIYGRPVQA